MTENDRVEIARLQERVSSIKRRVEELEEHKKVTQKTMPDHSARISDLEKDVGDLSKRGWAVISGFIALAVKTFWDVITGKMS